MHQRILTVLTRNPMLLVCLTALLVLLLAVAVFSRQQEALTNTLSQYYGDALARLAASQATDATLNHDLVSLHVIVRDVARNSGVAAATIHDVENQLLVQAGEVSTDLSDFSFSAPITFQNNIAGYLTVALNRDALMQVADSTWYTGLLGVLCALLVWSILNIKKDDQDSPASTEAPAESENNFEGPDRDKKYDGSLAYSLQFFITNRQLLLKQISPSLLEKLVRQLEQLTAGVNSVYGGKLVGADQETMILQFYGDDADSVVFRATCAATLLFRLLEKTPIGGTQLKLNAAVAPVDRTASIRILQQQRELESRCLEQLQLQPFHRLMLHEDCLSSALNQRLTEEDDAIATADWLKVVSLQTSYHGLLDRQCAQLLNLVESSSPR